MNKAKMEQEGRLPTVLNVTDAVAQLMEMRETADSMDESDMSDVDNNLENTNL